MKIDTNLLITKFILKLWEFSSFYNINA